MNLLASALLIVVSNLIVGTQSTGKMMPQRHRRISTKPISLSLGCNIQRDTIRLVGGLSDQGLVEICVDNQWESVCDTLWTDAHAESACQLLNLTYSGAQGKA